MQLNQCPVQLEYSLASLYLVSLYYILSCLWLAATRCYQGPCVLVVSQKKNLRFMTRELEKIIKVHTPAFSLDNEALPNVICDGCRVVMLYLHKVYIFFRYFWICIDI